VIDAVAAMDLTAFYALYASMGGVARRTIRR
jgi:hypothetical protein